ncbi:metallophosphoesterase [Pirellula staleyi DSM 6068]|uniref:Metallophosphoesterase n=1 Tax=Pirellula staleyi (strain ATCC 27377 / DSM 6068 / ICPB 4128) TaxID=530564 RepID=D2R4Y2_PIRSD|nr:metallophosphoesterase family protein [Pirellula staleyi]ADB18944.1 metallophosphoesterase [Pirellula staleyi DSM 6068]
MKRALISDIHANWEALKVVLDDIRAHGIKEIFCLGDIVGYGPNPCQCLDEIIAKSKITILGNHDQATLFDPDGFNPVALRAVYWTRQQLEEGPGTPAVRNRRWDFLGELHRTHTEGDYLFVHGSPREPTNEYIFPEDIYNQRKMDAQFGRIQKYCFQGHTHLPGIFTSDYRFVPPEDCNYTYRLPDEKTLVNVGSVGQPRDGDNRACYTILEDGVVTFRRLDYPVEETRRKIYEIPELDNMLGDRLLAGR